MHLRSLRIDHCPELSNLEDIRHCTSLSSLYLSGVLDNLAFLAHCPNLIGLSFDGFDNFSDLEFLERYPYLQTLSFESCENLADLSGLRHCQQLRCLFLEHCPNVLSFKAIVHFPLKRLSISHGRYGHCLEKLSLRGIGGGKTLEKINFFDGVPLDFTGIEEFAGLQAVEIDGGVRTLPNFYNCHNLKRFRISNCAQLEDIRGVLACNSLQSLHLDGCRRLQWVTSIPSPTSLKELRIFSCGVEQNFAGLQHAVLLERLSIGNCPGVENLDGLNCPRLKSLVLGRCNKLNNIDALRNLAKTEPFWSRAPSRYQCLCLS